MSSTFGVFGRTMSSSARVAPVATASPRALIPQRFEATTGHVLDTDVHSMTIIDGSDVTRPHVTLYNQLQTKGIVN